MSFYKFPLVTKPMQMSDLHQVQVRPLHGRARRVVPISGSVFEALSKTGALLNRLMDLPRLPARIENCGTFAVDFADGGSDFSA
jgi:hypothetical protein